MIRLDGRAPDQLRKITITRNYTKYAEGSCLIEFGDTRVLCTATVEESVPPFLKNSQTGWVTAEYGMLPRSCETRINREKTSGRTYEIQRLVGRALRGIVDTKKLGERTIKIDCDVIQGDGGTRTAAITGGYIALVDAVSKIQSKNLILTTPLIEQVAAISVGIFQKEVVLDLCYQEDSKADMDMNVVMVGSGKFVEVQGTAEGQTFSRQEVDQLLTLAQKGINELFEIQRKALSSK